MGVRQQLIGCLWVPILVAGGGLGLMVLGAVVGIVVAESAEQAQAFGRLIGLIGFPIVALASLVIAILGTRGGWLPGTKPDVPAEAPERQQDKGA